MHEGQVLNCNFFCIKRQIFGKNLANFTIKIVTKFKKNMGKFYKFPEGQVGSVH